MLNTNLSYIAAASHTPLYLPPGSTPPSDAEICRRIGIQPLGVNRRRCCVFRDVTPGHHRFVYRVGQKRIRICVYIILNRRFDEFISRGGKRPGTFSREQVRKAISNECWRLARQHGFIDREATA